MSILDLSGSKLDRKLLKWVDDIVLPEHFQAILRVI